MKFKIKVVSFLKFHTMLGACLGLICGLIYSLGGLVVDGLVSMSWIESAETPGLSIGTLLAFGALIGMPVIFAIGGFLLGLIEILLYQLFYSWLAGMDLDFIEKD